MNNIRERLVKRLMGWIFIAVGAGVSFVLHFTNPDMTHTRLFLEYWPYWLGVVSLTFAGYILFVISEK